uniref:Uncharacterized protein n=1 Tax=Siphoviridae sp. ctoOf8 TaxID=2825668 RepID=A0A8S5QFT8_9CAUD|nr:MAG TPA: hypothetical protein [Siphoviridae sp. ctoOf8]DAZ18977.1 MAG TPA: hypothetical protein [Caudoviricetes sp.]
MKESRSSSRGKFLFIAGFRSKRKRHRIFGYGALVLCNLPE